MKRSIRAGMALALLCSAAHAAAPPAYHKAIYKMALASSKQASIIDITGEMYYDFADGCDVYASDQRFALNYTYAEQADEKLVSQYTSREAKDGSRYDFAVQRSKNGAVEEVHVGTAHLNPDGTGTADYAQPQKEVVQLPAGVIFPTAHTNRMLDAIAAGQHVLNAQMFDGSDGGTAGEANAVMGQPGSPDITDEKLANSPFLKSPAHKIRLAFYPPDEPGKPQQSEPDYEMTLIMHENGVVSSMQIDYPTFTLKGTLNAIEAAAPPKC